MMKGPFVIVLKAKRTYWHCSVWDFDGLLVCIRKSAATPLLNIAFKF